MAVFSASEAKECEVKEFRKNFHSSTGFFKNYYFKIIDGKGNEYEWYDTHATLNYTTVTGVGLTDSQIAVYIYKYLTGGTKADGSAAYVGEQKITSVPVLKKSSSEKWSSDIVELSKNYGFINNTVANSLSSIVSDYDDIDAYDTTEELLDDLID